MKTKQELVTLILAGLFVATAVLGELTGGKLIQIGPFGGDLFRVGPFVMSIGVISWPVVFLTTDLINEYFGKVGVRRITFLTVALIVLMFGVLYIAMSIPAASFSPVTDEQFRAVFGQSMWIIVGSIAAFIVSQFVDVTVFWFFRGYTKGRFLWLRATGSTAISQLIDSFVIIGIAFWLPGKLKTDEFLQVAFSNYFYKFLIAVALTPAIYLGHALIDRYLGKEASIHLMEHASP